MRRLLFLLFAAGIPLALCASEAAATRLTIHVEEAKPISRDLFGIFFEDLNYAADGGLYAELIQNRSFEYNVTEQPEWNSLTSWELTRRGGGEGSWAIEAARPLHVNNPHYLVVEVGREGEGVGVSNPGFDGIAVKTGESYDFSAFARQLYMNRRWGSENSIEGKPMPTVVRLEAKDGSVLAEASLEIAGREWKRCTATLVASASNEAARFVLLAKASGGIALDEISLFPRKTFRDRANGLRADLAQVVADLHPKFIRFPGGCLAHGNGVNNFYRWQDTIGPIEQRRGQRNLWGYHQSVGLGYFEYFQFCEDIKAKPLPVVPAAVSCQNSDHTGGVGQQCLPMAEMPAYIQGLFDLVEWANGPASSPWGAKRAEAGHPKPFGLQYLGVGNEDHITSCFKERFRMIYEALKARHPEITVIGTVGPAHSGPDFENGWKIANELQLAMVDEHYYVSPSWFWNNLRRYDRYERFKSKVYLGEYAAHDDGRLTTLRSAIAEAAYMTGLERNGDLVYLSSYAPLLGKRGRTQWNPNLIYFTNTKVVPTINYYVQQLFSRNSGDACLETDVEPSGGAARLAFSAVRESQSGELIVKIVNGEAVARRVNIQFAGTKNFRSEAIKTVLAGDPMLVNNFETAKPLLPQTSQVTLVDLNAYDAPPFSLTVIRFESR